MLGRAVEAAGTLPWPAAMRPNPDDRWSRVINSGLEFVKAAARCDCLPKWQGWQMTLISGVMGIGTLVLAGFTTIAMPRLLTAIDKSDSSTGLQLLSTMTLLVGATLCLLCAHVTTAYIISVGRFKD